MTWCGLFVVVMGEDNDEQAGCGDGKTGTVRYEIHRLVELRDCSIVVSTSRCGLPNRNPREDPGSIPGNPTFFCFSLLAEYGEPTERSLFLTGNLIFAVSICYECMLLSCFVVYQWLVRKQFFRA